MDTLAMLPKENIPLQPLFTREKCMVKLLFTFSSFENE